MAYEASRTSDLDKVMVIKDLYGAVDHLEELLHFASHPTEIEDLKSKIMQLTDLRRKVTGSFNGDKHYACLFKHTAGAWKAAEEVWLAERTYESYQAYKELSDVFYWVAERFLGHELSQCERCDDEDGKPSEGILESI